MKKLSFVIVIVLLLTSLTSCASTPSYDKYTAYNIGNYESNTDYPNEVKEWGYETSSSRDKEAAKLEEENITGKKLIYQAKVRPNLSSSEYYIFNEENSLNSYKIDVETGYLVGAYFYDTQKAASKAETVPDNVDYETIARDFISQYIACSKYSVTLSEAQDGHFCLVTFTKYFSCCATSEYAIVKVYNTGDVISFELSMIGKFDNITELTWDQEKCEEVVKSKISDIYSDKLVNYSISRQTIVLYDDETPAILFEVSVEYFYGDSTVGELRTLLVFI